MNHHIITARDMMENEAVSWAAIGDFLFPPSWMLTLGRSAISFCDIFGHGFLLKLLASFAKVFMFGIILFFLWVPYCVFYRGACFYLASWIRLGTGMGQRHGVLKNLWFVGGYSFLFVFFYIAWLIPKFTTAVSCSGISEYLNLI